MFKTRITEMLGIKYPILCGGMQWLSRAAFVAEICNAGGIAFITAESLETPEDLREEIRLTRTLTDKPFGVNLSMVPEFGILERTQQFCDVICEEGVKVVETAGTSPAPLLPKLKEANIKVIHKLTSVRHALSAQKHGVDAVTLIGYGSGGHIGMEGVANFVMIPRRLIHALFIGYLLYASFHFLYFIDFLQIENKNELFGEMVYEKPYLEGTREFLGLLMAAVALLLQFKKKKFI